MEGVERAIRILIPEHLQGLVLWRGSKGKKTQVLVLAVGDHLSHQLVLRILQFVLGLTLQLRIFFECIMGIRQGNFQLHGALASLAAVGLVHDDGKSLAGCVVYLFIDHGELLQSGDDDPLAVVQSVPQIFGGLLLVDGHYRTQGVVEARDSLLELGVQHRAVCDDDHRVEDGLVVIVMEAGQTVGGPGDRVGLPGTGAVLHQIVFAGAVGSDILDQPTHHIHLVIPGEDD